MLNELFLEKDPVLSEIVNGLIHEFRPTRIYLFGSRARGDAKIGSDYDLLVIVPSGSKSRIELAQRAHRKLLRHIPAPVDIVFFSEEKFQERKTVIGSLSETALYEGKELYVA